MTLNRTSSKPSDEISTVEIQESIDIGNITSDNANKVNYLRQDESSVEENTANCFKIPLIKTSGLDEFKCGKAIISVLEEVNNDISAIIEALGDAEKKIAIDMLKQALEKGRRDFLKIMSNKSYFSQDQEISQSRICFLKVDGSVMNKESEKLFGEINKSIDTDFQDIDDAIYKIEKNN